MFKMESEIFQQPGVLASVAQANEDVLNRLVGEVKRRGVKSVVFAARGTSDHASIYGEYMLAIYAKVLSGLSLPSTFTLYGAETDLKDALVIGVSQSGKAADVLAVMESCARQGGVVAAVTNDLNSPMAKATQFHLYCNAGLEESVAATKTFTAQMYLLALLAAKWGGRTDLEQELARVPAALRQMLDTVPQKLDATIARYRYMTEGFVLARGLNYPIALESALKIQETNYIKMKGYAISDFYHGPMAQVHKDIAVIVFAAKGPAFENAREIVDKLEEIGAEVVVVSDDQAYAQAAKIGFAVPDLGSDALSPFLFAAFAQLFACKLAAQRGYNPDAPRLLKKVTITV